MDRRMISCFDGLAALSMPGEWLNGFNPKNSFAYVEGEARIRFPNGKAFGVRIDYNDFSPNPCVRSLSVEEIEATPWGPFCSPWELYEVAFIFGHGKVIALDEI